MRALGCLCLPTFIIKKLNFLGDDEDPNIIEKLHQCYS